jgi:sugar/nucleoside kinase (ribokinase family)
LNSVIVVGSLNIDHVVHAPRHPEIGETILGSEFRTFFGGKGANQAVAASRCGAPVVMVGRVGTDALGEAILQNLHGEGIDWLTCSATPMLLPAWRKSWSTTRGAIRSWWRREPIAG